MDQPTNKPTDKEIVERLVQLPYFSLDEHGSITCSFKIQQVMSAEMLIDKVEEVPLFLTDMVKKLQEQFNFEIDGLNKVLKEICDGTNRYMVINNMVFFPPETNNIGFKF